MAKHSTSHTRGGTVADFVEWIDAKLDYLNSADGARSHSIYWSSVWDEAKAHVYSVGLSDVAEGLGGELPCYGGADDAVNKTIRDQLRKRLVELRLKLAGRAHSETSDGITIDDNSDCAHWLYEQWQNERKVWVAIHSEYEAVRQTKRWPKLTVSGIRSRVTRYVRDNRLPFRKGKGGAPKRAK